MKQLDKEKIWSRLTEDAAYPHFAQTPTLKRWWPWVAGLGIVVISVATLYLSSSSDTAEPAASTDSKGYAADLIDSQAAYHELAINQAKGIAPETDQKTHRLRKVENQESVGINRPVNTTDKPKNYPTSQPTSTNPAAGGARLATGPLASLGRPLSTGDTVTSASAQNSTPSAGDLTIQKTAVASSTPVYPVDTTAVVSGHIVPQDVAVAPPLLLSKTQAPPSQTDVVLADNLQNTSKEPTIPQRIEITADDVESTSTASSIVAALPTDMLMLPTSLYDTTRHADWYHTPIIVPLTRVSPHSIWLATGAGSYRVATSDTLERAVSSVLGGQQRRSAHLQLGYRYDHRKLFVQAGVGISVLSSISSLSTARITYEENRSSNQVEKLQYTTSYKLPHYLQQYHVDLCIGRRFDSRYLQWSIYGGVQYMAAHRAEGRLLDTSAEAAQVIDVDNYLATSRWSYLSGIQVDRPVGKNGSLFCKGEVSAPHRFVDDLLRNQSILAARVMVGYRYQF